MNWLIGLGVGIGGFVLAIGLVQVILAKFSASANEGNATAAIVYGQQQLGSTGLLGWLGAVIAIVVGGFLFANFLGGGKRYK